MSKIKMNNVRLSFPSLFRKASFNGVEGKYEATFILDKKEHAAVIKQIQAEIAERVKTDLKGTKLPGDKLCLKDGDELGTYENSMVLKAGSTKRPIVIGRDKAPLTEDDNVIYGGCYVNAIIDLWTQNNQFGKRINANLHAVQFAKDGEPFADKGGRIDVDSEFDIIDDSDEF